MKSILMRRGQRGMALALALSVVLVTGLAASYFYRRYEANKDFLRQENLKKDLSIRAMGNIDGIKAMLRRVIFALSQRTEANNVIPRFNYQRTPEYWNRLIWNFGALQDSNVEYATNIQRRLMGQTWGGDELGAPLTPYPKKNSESVSITCVDKCNNDPTDVPKLFDLQYVLRSEDSQSAVQVKVQIALQPPSINNIAYMVRRQPSATPLVISSLSQVKGKFMVLFDLPTDERAEIRFLNQQPIDFLDEFVTNADNRALKYGVFGYDVENDQQASSNAAVNFHGGFVANAPDPSTSMDQGFRNLITAVNTDNWNDSYAGYSGPIVMALGKTGSGEWIYDIYKETAEAIVTEGNSNEKFVQNKNETEDKAEDGGKEADGSEMTSASLSECSGGTCRTYIAQDVSVSTARTAYINTTSPVVLRSKGSPGQISSGKSPLTILTQNQISIGTSIVRADTYEPTEGNLALVSLNSNITVDSNATSLASGATLSSISQSGVPGGVASDQDVFRLDAALVALNGSFSLPPNWLSADANPLGQWTINGAMMTKELSPLNASNDGVIVAGVQKLNLNFNPGVLQTSGTPPGFQQSDVSTLSASLVGTVSVNFVEQAEAEKFFASIQP